MKPSRCAVLAGTASLVVISAIFTGCTGHAAPAATGFSANSLKGSYALGLIGSDKTIGPVAGTGVITSTGNG